MRRRQAIGPALIAVAVIAGLAVTVGPLAGGQSGAPPGGPQARPTTVPAAVDDETARPTAHPIPGHELFGFVPYWEMNDGIAEHLAKTPLTTLALFSVTHTKTGAIDTGQTGYKRITGAIGKQLIAEAHDRHTAVQLVYSSFGAARNGRFFGSATLPGATVDGLVDLAVTTGVDGIDVDVEQLGPEFIPAYGAFVGKLREALVAKLPHATVSVATPAGGIGAAMAAAAIGADADRVFLMGYDYHYAGSEPGASAPLDRRDGAQADLQWSLDVYGQIGVPAERTVLGLPLYGMRWRVSGPEIGASRLGDGAIWVPADNPKFLAHPPTPAEFDPIEVVDFYSVAPTVTPSPGDSRATAGWQAVYVDSPDTLRPKLALADERGLAGAGFWAIGYERGLAGYRELMTDFTKGKLD
ncbi:MAG: glycoside hydrolase family 18 protein [Chloroflexota bacterium]